MTIEALPMGFSCGRACTYCYQTSVREVERNTAPPYDLTEIMKALEDEGYAFTVFGGEPLLMPVSDLEKLWAWGQQRFGAQARADGSPVNGIQTDGYLLSDKHVELIARYEVSVGMSIDGPGDLNDARAMRKGGIEATRAGTAKSEQAIEKLCAAGRPPSLIATLHRINASPDRLPRLLEWFRAMSDRGVRNVNLHLMEIDTAEAADIALSEDETVEALLSCARLQAEITMSFQPLSEMEKLLRGGDREGVSCVWGACDPYTTDAVRGVDGQGNRRNCGRTYKDGVASIKADRHGYERYVALYHTPQAYGGCAGCRFFYACKGQCPGDAEQGDWRGKTDHCRVLMRVFEALEAAILANGETPFSLQGERLALEAEMLARWSAGQAAYVTATREAMEAGHTVNHGDTQHGDSPHGDSHGDHTDANLMHPEAALWQRV